MGFAPTSGRASTYGDAAEEHQQGAVGAAQGWRGNTVPPRPRSYPRGAAARILYGTLGAGNLVSPKGRFCSD